MRGNEPSPIGGKAVAPANGTIVPFEFESFLTGGDVPNENLADASWIVGPAGCGCEQLSIRTEDNIDGHAGVTEERATKAERAQVPEVNRIVLHTSGSAGQKISIRRKGDRVNGATSA